jgi:hypothetical protein
MPCVVAGSCCCQCAVCRALVRPCPSARAELSSRGEVCRMVAAPPGVDRLSMPAAAACGIRTQGLAPGFAWSGGAAMPKPCLWSVYCASTILPHRLVRPLASSPSCSCETCFLGGGCASMWAHHPTVMASPPTKRVALNVCRLCSCVSCRRRRDTAMCHVRSVLGGWPIPPSVQPRM